MKIGSYKKWFLCRVHVVFGHVVDGEDVVQNIESIPVNEMSRPIQDVKIANCGELILKSKRNYFRHVYFNILTWQTNEEIEFILFEVENPVSNI